MKRGAILGIVGGAVVLAAVAAVGVWWFTSRPQSAEAAAVEYLRALEAGDYAAIEPLLAGAADPSLEAAFASADAYAGDARITDISEGADGGSTVRAEAVFAGEELDLSFVLTSSDGRWILTPDSLALLRVDTTHGGAPGGGDSVWIGDALVPTATDLALLPAVYRIEAAPRGILSGSATTPATSDGSVRTVAIDTTLSPEATAIAQAQLDGYLDACVAPAAQVPENCGIRIPWAADLTTLESIAFRIDERPVLALSADATGFAATGGVLVATATGASRDGGSGAFTYRADDWAVRGSVAFVGDEMVLSVR